MLILSCSLNTARGGFQNGGRKIIYRFNSSSTSRWKQRQKNDHYSKQAKLQNLRSRAAFKLIEIDDKWKLFSKERPQCILDLGFAPGSWSEVAKSRTSPDSMVLGVDILPCNPPTGVSSIQANIFSKQTQGVIRHYFDKHFKFKLNAVDKLHKDYGYFHNYNDPKLNEFETYNELFSSDDDVPIELPNRISEKFPVDVIISDMYVPWPRDFSNFSSSNLTNMPYFRLMNTSGVAVRDHLQSIDLCDAALVTAIDLLKPGGSFLCKLYTGTEDRLFEKRVRNVFRKVAKVKPSSSRNESRELYFVGLDKRDPIDKVTVFTS
ncbi:hypothetical protein KAFR_0A06980 [Kazachstania africana CBS 2517]|uniref:rRNA methyltransferase 2, mitochondrial n=1 Tax=Kazachstania africana (strain ATCC 22294 / BCRC 22015 / CBS 2517 / CECT 1963 / NBRC 1671 / NRRL Y-8276) TaxID=1071382 RepID=H2AP33_KAZAF|nr:hypothetical protein KAFR_0A06980 [Kazachstania africana CBS 2517]CCF56133.1 hypothetical protein KAFR_0A06980 [Kazachstania africana CBS 2517]